MNDETEIEHFEAKLKCASDSGGRYDRRKEFNVGYDPKPVTNGCYVTLDIHANWGHPDVYAELTPLEARKLAGYLTLAADYAENQL